MTPSSVVDEIMESRAEKLAKRTKAALSTEKKMSVTVFDAGSEQFGIPTDSLICIVKTPAVAPLPHLPVWMKGIAQVRGEIVSVIDLASWFEVPVRSNASFTAVVEGTKGKLGLLVDGVRGFREIGVSDLAETFNDASVTSRPIRATTKDLTTILDVEKLFLSSDIQMDLRVTAERTRHSALFSEQEERSE